MYIVRAELSGSSTACATMLQKLTPTVLNPTDAVMSSQLLLYSATTSGKRVVLLLRHGQCCREGEGDELKALTIHGHKQADETARYIKGLFDNLKIPNQRALLHSTSRRARETAARIFEQMPR